MQGLFENLYILTYTQHQTPSERQAKALLNELVQFNKVLEGKSQHLRLVFKMKNDALIRQLRSFIIDMYKGNTHIMKELRLMFDENFQYNPKDLTMRCTEIFEQFIRGITVFQHDDDLSVPIYHREKSCGSKQLSKNDYRSSRTCMLEHSVEQLKRNKMNIYNCYLERSIYDKLFGHYHGALFTTDLMSNSRQDPGHRKKLEETREYFWTCYPNMELEIDIEYDEALDLPIKLTITKKSKRLGQVLGIEEFMRTLNETRDITTYMDLYNSPVVMKETKPSGLVRYKVLSY